MYILDINKLEEGDVLLTSQKGLISKTIRKFTNSDYSHAILYVGHGSYIHSDENGVHSDNIQRLLFKKGKYAKVLRPRNRAFARAASIFARTEIGKQYSVKDAVNTKINNQKKPSNRQFCSRLVAQSYEYAGMKLVNNSAYCSPEEINESPKLKMVPGVVRLATDSEVKFASSHNPIYRQSEITNQILRSTRKLTSYDVQTLEELSRYVIKNKQYDTQIVKIFKDSGYLSMWEDEMAKNPWRYDGKIFLSLPIGDEEKRHMATFEIESAIEQLQLYKHNYSMYKQLSMHGMQYIEMNMQLYNNLINQMNKRQDAADYVLNNL